MVQTDVVITGFRGGETIEFLFTKNCSRQKNPRFSRQNLMTIPRILPGKKNIKSFLMSKTFVRTPGHHSASTRQLWTSVHRAQLYSIHCRLPSQWQTNVLSLQHLCLPKHHYIHLTFRLKERAPILFCLLKLRFLLFRFLLELTFFFSFVQCRPLLDSLCLVIHLPVFVFTPLPVRLLTLCSARWN